MIDLLVSLNRTNLLYGVHEMEAQIDGYHKALIEHEEFLRVHGWDFERLFGNKDLIEKARELVHTEIKYCEFWKRHQLKKNEPGFNTWIFSTKAAQVEESVKAGRTWAFPAPCDKWTRNNGKTKATVEIDRTGAMTRLRLYIENAYDGIDFFPRSRWGEELDRAHLKNEDAITARVEDMKRKAEGYQVESQLPAYLQEAQNLEALRQLLCMEV